MTIVECLMLGGRIARTQDDADHCSYYLVALGSFC